MGYRWDFENDGDYDTDWLNISFVNYSYPVYGNYTVKLQVKDDGGPLGMDILYDEDLAEVSINAIPFVNTNGPYFGNINEIITFDGSGSYDPDGYIVNWSWDFGDSTTGYGETIDHSYQTGGVHIVNLTVMDNLNVTGYNLTTAFINSPPNIPIINGPNSGKVGEEYCWNISSVDPEGDNLMYIVDWGDGETTETECYPSGIQVEVCHTYTGQGTYIIKVKAKECPDGLVGPEESFTITITKKSKTINTLFLTWLQGHPYMFPLLQILFYRFGLQ